MRKYFGECQTIEQLNEQRQALLQEINAEYSEVRKEVLSKPAPFKSVPVFYMESIEKKDFPKYVPINIADEKAPANEIHIKPDFSMKI